MCAMRVGRSSLRSTSSDSFAALGAVIWGGLFVVFIAAVVVIPGFFVGLEIFASLTSPASSFSALAWENLVWNLAWGVIAGATIGLIRYRMRHKLLEELIGLVASSRMVTAAQTGFGCVLLHMWFGALSCALIGLMGLNSPLHVAAGFTDMLTDTSRAGSPVALLTSAGFFNGGGAPPGGSEIWLLLLVIAILVIAATVLLATASTVVMAAAANAMIAGGTKGLGKTAGLRLLLLASGLSAKPEDYAASSWDEDAVSGEEKFIKESISQAFASGFASGLWAGLVNTLIVFACLYIVRSTVFLAAGPFPRLGEPDHITSEANSALWAVAIPAGENALLLAAQSGSMLFDLTSRTVLWRVPAAAKAAAFAPGRREVFIADYGRIIRVNAQTGGQSRWLDFRKPNFSTMELAPVLGGQALAIQTGSEIETDSIEIRDSATAELLHTLTKPSGRDGYLQSFASSPDAALAAGAYKWTGDQFIVLWDLRSGAITRIIGAGGPAALSPKGDLLASAGGYDSFWQKAGIRIWDTETGKLLRTIGTSAEWLTALSFAGGGDLLAGAGKFGEGYSVQLWDAASGRGIQSRALHDVSSLSAMTVALDGKAVAFSTPNSSSGTSVSLFHLR
jgi:hypothetical protein